MPDEPVVFEPKKVPTQVKHWILERCLRAWGGIITNSNLGEVRLCFVDTCCGSGLYRTVDQAEAQEGVYEVGSALIGPQVLAELRDHAASKARAVKTRALLINRDERELETARSAIYGAGIDRTIDEIRFEAQALEDVERRVAQFTLNWFSFVFVDPFGPKPTPFSLVADIVRGRYTDTLINFPFYSFQKWAGFLERPPSDDERAKLEAADAFMGGPAWRALAQKARSSGAALERVLIDHYLESLTRLGVHAIEMPLMFEDRERVMYHLVFTSHNVAGLASAKEKFQAAKDRQFQLRQEVQVRRKKQGFLDLGLPSDQEAVDLEALVNLLAARFRGMTVTLERVILEGLKLHLVLEGDVRKALTSLKRDGRAQYADLKRWGTKIAFHTKADPQKGRG